MQVGLSVEDEAADERIKPLLTSFKVEYHFG